MKIFILAIVCLFAISATNGGKLVREKRGLISCTTKVPTVVKDCSKKLEDELDFDDKISKELQEETPGEFKCCYFAKFTYCLKSNLKDECGDTFASMASTYLNGAAKLLQPKCEDYDYPSMTCVFFVWFYYIVGAIIVLFLLSLGCCIARCICGRK